MEFSFSGYSQPTPVMVQKIGHALLVTSVTIGTYSIYNDYKVFGIIAICMGAIGQFLSTFFTADTPGNIQDK